MKRILTLFVLIFLFAGCGDQSAVEPGLRLREKILNGEGCSFLTTITADYGEQVYKFSMQCRSDRNGNLSFTVTAPETIADIQGMISGQGGSFMFDKEVLTFETIADGQVTPVSAPWLFVKTLTSGYIRSCETKKSGIHLIYDDSYNENALQVDVYLSPEGFPVQSDILWAGKRILSLQIEEFQIL